MLTKRNILNISASIFKNSMMLGINPSEINELFERSSVPQAILTALHRQYLRSQLCEWGHHVQLSDAVRGLGFRLTAIALVADPGHVRGVRLKQHNITQHNNSNSNSQHSTT